MLAGMNVAAGPELAAAVSNAGGIGVIGGVGYTPETLRESIEELKARLAATATTQQYSHTYSSHLCGRVLTGICKRGKMVYTSSIASDAVHCLPR